MSDKFNANWLILVIGGLISGCTQEGSPAAIPVVRAKKATGQNQIRSTADLKRILVQGMRTNEIIALLGQPNHQFGEDPGQQMWIYELPPFPGEGNRSGVIINSVTLSLTNGSLLRFDYGFTLDETHIGEIELTPLIEASATLPTPSIDFYVVHQEPLTDGKYVNTPVLPALGFIASRPDLSLRSVKRATIHTYKTKDESGVNRVLCEIGLSFAGEDALKFHSLTKSNLSRRLLFSIGEQIISAPLIVAPIEEGNLGIRLTDPGHLGMVTNVLRKLLLRNPEQ